jgi:hypothetical protein
MNRLPATPHGILSAGGREPVTAYFTTAPRQLVQGLP